MKIGMTLPTMVPDLTREHVHEWSRRIDAGPYASLALGERITFPNIEAMVTMTTAAAVTERVELMFTVIVLPMHSEGLMAKQIATLDVMSNGRVTLGVGTGGREEDFMAVGAPFSKRLSRMEAQVARMRTLWAGEPPHEGAAPIGPKPVQEGGPQILVGAITEKSIQKSARWADGICGFTFGPNIDQVDKSFRLLEAAWKEQGRTGSPRRISSFFYALGPDAQGQMDRYVRRYLGIFGEDVAAAMAKECVATSPGQLRDLMAKFEDLGADDLVLVPTSENPAEIDRVSDLLG
jgi:alkanesulfonate monooxygenase SsuD/methylene tetrahydromethanopterin reductase-like flavin-dependent oxidoreductase (luciferase family)